MSDHDRRSRRRLLRARIARALGFATVSVLTIVAGLTTLIAAEGLWAHRRLQPQRVARRTAPSGVFGGENAGTELRLVLMGDSLAVGYGSEDEAQTVGVILATRLASASERPVRLDNLAEVGAESIDLIAQLVAVRRLPSPPDVAVIIVGTNDAMRLRPLVNALRPLSATILELRRAGAHVVLATCPDLGTIRSLFEPLRSFAHSVSRLLATSQTIVALRAGARTVSLADALGPLFRREPDSMFSDLDRLHPSGLGYARAAEVMLPSVLAAAGYPADAAGSVPFRVYDGKSRRPLTWLAFRASRRAGRRLRPAQAR